LYLICRFYQHYTVTRHRWNCQELLKKYIIFRSALIHVLAHFQNFPNLEHTCTLLTIIHRVHKQYIFDFEKFPVITSLYTFRKRKCIHPRGTECLPF
jgi:hypothetical protein